MKDVFGRPLRGGIDLRFATDHRVPDLTFEHTYSVLEAGVPTHVPVFVTNLNSITLDYETLTTEGRNSGSRTFPAYDAEDTAYRFPLKLRELIPGPSGAIQGRWDSTPSLADRYAYGELPRWFFSQVTPFEVHVKAGHYNTLVWVTRMDDGAPVAGAHVSAYVDSFGTFGPAHPSLADAQTNVAGIAMLPGTRTLDPELHLLGNWHRKGEHLFLRIQHGSDLALAPLVYDFEAYPYGAGDNYIPTQFRPRFGHLRAWGFTAQGVYKAGDTIQYKLYVRDQDNKRYIAAPRRAYRLRIFDPTGKAVHEVSGIELSEFGAYSGEFTVPRTAAVGWYRFELSPSVGNLKLEALRVLVSDFTPAAFRVRSELNGTVFKIGDRVQISTQANLHAGGPYANADSRVTAVLSAESLTADDPAAQGFYFEPQLGKTRSVTLHKAETSLDSTGTAITRFELPASDIVYGRLEVESAVRDDRGKYVAGRSSATYLGRDRYVGLRQDDWLLQAGRDAEVKAVVVNAQGKLVPGTPIDLRIDLRQTKAARVRAAGNAYVTQYSHEWTPVHECHLQSGTKPQTCRFEPPKAGYYRLAAQIHDTEGRDHRTEIDRWATGPEAVVWETRPGHALEVVAEKSDYHVGDTARFLVQNPFPGAQALVTVERFGVLQSWVTTLAKSTELIEVPVTEDSLPGFYLSVLVMSPRVADAPDDEGVDLGKPAFRMGYVRVPVRDAAKQIEVEVNPQAAEYRPGSEVEVDLQVRSDSDDAQPVELAVAVLDEAVFDLLKAGRTRYDPYEGFYSLDALDVRNFNLLTQLIGIQRFDKKGANAGGDGGADLSLRSLFKFVSYWNPALRPDADGHARIRFKAPDNLTAWRVLAVAVTPEDRMGLGDASFRVNQPTEIRPALPNQVVEDDRFEARFTVMNRTDTMRRLRVELAATGSALQRPTQRSVKIDAAPYARVPVNLPVHATAAGQIRFTVRAGDDQDRDAVAVALAVKPRQTLLTAASYGSTDGESANETVALPADIRTDVGRLSVLASPTLIAGLDGAFGFLRDYPYGCWEQKLTKAVMAAGYQSLQGYVDPDFAWPESTELPRQTLAHAADYQTPSGAMSYFLPLDQYADAYLSAYTALAFNWLRDAGYDVPVEVEEHLAEYLLNLLRQDVFPDFYSQGMTSTVRAVALAALAPRGRLTADDLERYRPHLPRMSLFGQAHFLQAALHLDGVDPSVVKEARDAIMAKSNRTGGKLVFTETLDSAYLRILSSDLRSNCAVLSALLAGATDEPGRARDAAGLVQTITQARKQRDHWENTQENVFCTAALSDYSRHFENTPPDLRVTAKVDDQTLGRVEFHSFRSPPREIGRALTSRDPGRTLRVTVERQGAGRLYYATRLSYAPRELPAESVSAGIEVAREYSVQRDGQWRLLSDPMKISAGELVRVDIYLRLAAARNFVVVDDAVPGGLEPVNRDLATASQIDAAEAKFTPAGGSFWFRASDWREYGVALWSFYHKELRHDSVRFYSDYLPAGDYHLAYTAQAIAPGEFTVLPLHAEEMYNPDTFGKTAPAQLVVAPAP